ncbi:efflux RND transporter permease subunit [Brachybacterium sp. Z12]|uniref:efflux RND transporter permease subunit n=1 Tax=Brachybacterium sp. Z12 TaxID=2759167 RepID=UPI00223B53C0|nr:efflux RND transporter permease subunit [Brachybacterium sp. Z12]
MPDGVSEVGSDLQSDQPTAVVTVDREAAAQLGLTEEAVIGMVAQQMYPGAIGTITLDDNELDIHVAADDTIDTFDQLRGIELMGSIPLEDVASVEEELSRPSIATQDGLETVTVSITPAGEDVGIATDAANAAIEDAELPEGVDAALGGGTAADIDETFGQLGIAMLAAILLVYVLLVWIFKSLVQPLILLVSIPFAATGSLGLLLITGVPLGLPSMIGLLMLVGVVVTNAIVLIDLVNQYRRAGMSLDEALHEGSAKRLRPILMTAAATIFALIPMALGITGNGGFIAQPLAVVVIGGLISSTLLTLVIVPVLYRIAEGRGSGSGCVRRSAPRSCASGVRRSRRRSGHGSRRSSRRRPEPSAPSTPLRAPSAPPPPRWPPLPSPAVTAGPSRSAAASCGSSGGGWAGADEPAAQPRAPVAYDSHHAQGTPPRPDRRRLQPRPDRPPPRADRDDGVHDGGAGGHRGAHLCRAVPGPRAACQR